MKRFNILFWSLLVFIFIAKLIYIGWGPLDLAPDEAHYWDWSRHLDLSYYSKGPLIAYNIFLGVKLGKLFGITPPNPSFWVRVPAVINSTLLGIFAWLLTNRIWKDKKSAFYAILVLTAIPIYAVGSIIMTVDNPLMLFWALYIYFLLLALNKGEGRYWYLSGIMLGLGFLSKYTMMILIPSVFIYLLTTRQHRHWLKRKEFYLGMLIALLFFMPIVLWNIKHNWIGFRHLIGQAGLAQGFEKEPFFSLRIFEFIGIQFGVISPIIFIFIIIGLVKAWRLREDYRYNLLFWLGVPLGIFYLLLSLHEYCQANWPAPMYFSGSILIGGLFCGKRVLKIGICLGLLLWLLVFSIDLIPNLPNRLDPTMRLRGWKKLGTEVGKIRDRFIKQGPLFIFSDRYQITSELAFYVPGQPATYCVNTGRRMNQYDLWKGFDGLIGYNAIYVKHRDQEMEPEIVSAFKSWEKLPLIDIKKGNELIQQYSVFLCRGFKGMKNEKYEISY